MSVRVYLPTTVAEARASWPSISPGSRVYGVEPGQRGIGGEAEEELEYQAMLAAAAHAAAREVAQPGGLAPGRMVVALDAEPAVLEPGGEEAGDSVLSYSLTKEPGRERIAAVFLDEDAVAESLPSDTGERLERLLESPMLWFDPGEIDVRFGA